MTALFVDPVVCLASRVCPEDGAPLCGAWLSEHCPECELCPGLHADDCEGPRASEIRCPRCGYVHPWHGPDCVTPRSTRTDSKED